MEFNAFAEKVNTQFNNMTANQMFTVDIDRSTFGDAYLAAFPAGSDPLFIERTEHDCQICRQFIKFIGTVVTINGDGTLNTVWDIADLKSPYLEVAAELARQVRRAPIKSIFLHNEPRVGKQNTFQLLEDGSTRKWDHFWADIPNKFYTRDIATQKGMSESRASVHERSLSEISLPTLDTLIDILQNGSVYRGEEHLSKIVNFYEMKKAYEATFYKNSYAWLTYKNPGAGIRNTVIGSLLLDIEKGINLEQAVKSFEAKVAPANYKRPKAVVTKKMLESAIKVIDAKGIRSALPRRQALPSDVSVADVIYADRSIAMKDQDPLMDLLEPQATEIKGLDAALEITMKKFISDIVPKSSSINIVTSSSISANKVQISAPENKDAINILQWDNNFSWSYAGNMSDSDIAHNVKAAGGAIDGFVRCSLQWNEGLVDRENDLDLHCMTPKGHIYYNNRNAAGGTLDVDIVKPNDKIAVENITWPTQNSLIDGKYRFFVNNYLGINTGGFRAEIVIDGQTFKYKYDRPVEADVVIAVVTVKDNNVTIEHKLPHTGFNFGALVPVKMIMLSPNYWGNNNSGNKHYIFITDEEQSPVPFRGFYNEFLAPELHEIRKPMNMLASKMMCTPVENGLSGYGFSSTKRAHVYLKADHKLFKVMV